MREMSALETGELLALGRRALEMEARRFGEIAAATDADDQPLRQLLRNMALEFQRRAAEVEQQGALLPEDGHPNQGLRFIRGYLTSLNKSFGEGPLLRDAAMFYAESLEEETSRFFRALAEHVRDWPVNRLFLDIADRERDNVRYLREVVFEE